MKYIVNHVLNMVLPTVGLLLYCIFARKYLNTVPTWNYDHMLRICSTIAILYIFPLSLVIDYNCKRIKGYLRRMARREAEARRRARR